MMVRQAAWESARQVVQSGADLDVHVVALASQLRAYDGPFGAAADATFTNDPADVHAWLVSCGNETVTHGTSPGMFYVEMNGFDINYDRWFVDVFPLLEPAVADGRVQEASWSEIEGARCRSMDLIGMERMQAAFRWYHEELPREQRRGREDEHTLASYLVQGRLWQLFREVVAVGPLAAGDVEVAVVPHEMDPVLRFRRGQQVVENDERVPVTGDLRRRTPVPVRDDGYYKLSPLEGSRDVHPRAIASHEDGTWDLLCDLDAWVRDMLPPSDENFVPPDEPPVLELEQPVFEDVLPTNAGGIWVVSDALLQVLRDHAGPESIVSSPVLVASSQGGPRTYHVIHVIPEVDTVHVSREARDAVSRSHPAIREEDARRYEVFRPSSFFTDLALVSGRVAREVVRRGCDTGMTLREIMLV